MSLQGNLADLEKRPVGRLLWDYSLPAVVGMLVMSLYNVIDRIFIGQGVGVDAIAGLTLTFPLMNLATALGVLVGAGASARVSIMLGGRQQRSAELVLGNALTLTIINAAIYITVFAIFMDDFLRAFGASEKSLPFARDFLMNLLPGLLMTNIAFSLNNIIRASGYPMRAMFTMIIGSVSNLILAPIFIFALDMGIRGAAIATDISMFISAVFVLWHFFDKKATLRFTRGSFGLQWHTILAIISIGAAPALVNVAGSAINVIINTTLAHYGGDLSIAAAGIFVTYTSLITMVIIGICQGMQPIVGFNYGAGRLDRLKRAFWLATLASSILCILGSVGGQTMGHYIARCFTTDPQLINVTVHSLSISLVAFWVVGFQIVSTNFFQSIGQAGKSIFLSLIRQVLILIPLLMTLPRLFDVDGVWMSFPISDLGATAVTAVMIWWQFRLITRGIAARKGPSQAIESIDRQSLQSSLLQEYRHYDT